MNPSRSSIGAGDPSSPWVRRALRLLSVRGATWMLLGLCLGLTALICQQAWNADRQRQAIRFAGEARTLANAIEERLLRYRRLLNGVHGLFAASEEVTREEFHAYVSDLGIATDYPGILALGYVEKVEPAGRGALVRELAREWPELETPPRIWPEGAGPAGEAWVIRFVEPAERNLGALGYDIRSEPRRRASARRAASSGAAALSARLELVQAPGRSATVLLAPVYAGGGLPETEMGRAAALDGWVYAAFLTEEVMSGVRGHVDSPLDYEIFDGTQPDESKLLCRSGTLAVAAGDPWRIRIEQLKVFDRPWTLRMQASDQATAGRGLLPGGVLAGGGVCMSLLVFGVAHSMATTGRRAYAIASDMTAELRRKEEALRASEERLAMVIEGSNDGIWDWDIRSNDVYFSRRWKSMLGYEEDEIGNRFSAWEALIHPDDRERAREVVNRYFRGETSTYQLEHRLRHKDGSYRWILSRGVAARDESGSPVRMAGSHVDLTELKAAERELRRSNRELELSKVALQRTLADLRRSHEQLEATQLQLIQAAKLESVGTLAAGVAHEVKNPLQIIVMGLDYLDGALGDPSEDTRLVLGDMRDAALRANSITRELLQFSASTSFEVRPASLEEVLKRSLWLIHGEFPAHGVKVEKQLSGDLPPVAIDSPKIQQVLINVMMNALQAMAPSGVLTVRTFCGRPADVLPPTATRPPGFDELDEVVVLQVLDTGPGIPPELMRRIFDPFFTTKAVGIGSGLGLSVVKRIIDLHGGVIHLQNSPDGGLEVTLAFAASNEPGIAPAAGADSVTASP